MPSRILERWRSILPKSARNTVSSRPDHLHKWPCQMIWRYRPRSDSSLKMSEDSKESRQALMHNSLTGKKICKSKNVNYHWKSEKSMQEPRRRTEAGRYRVFHNCAASQDCGLIFKIMKRHDLLCFDIRSLALDAILYSSQLTLEDLIKKVLWNGLKCQLNPVN
jgi:hypothetical protein